MKRSEIDILLDRRKKLKSRQSISDKDEDEIDEIEQRISGKCQERNKNKVMETFGEMNGVDGNLAHQGIWKAKQTFSPKIKPS